MPEQVRCPSCNAALRVPETLLGKNVKCPKCQTTFLAEMEEPAEPEEIVREPRPAARRRPRPPEDIEEEEELPAEEELEEEYEERPRRRRRGRRRHAMAESMVAAPAICLMIIGGLGILAAIIFLVAELTMNPTLNRPAPPSPRPGDPAFQAGYMVGYRIGKASVYGGGVFGVIWGIILLVGALRMKQLKNYGLAMTTAVLAMLPCNCCCGIGLPLGIWALTVLNKPEVKDSFS